MIFKQQMSVWIFSLNLPLNFGRQWRVGRSNKEVEVSHQVWFFVCLYFLQKKKKKMMTALQQRHGPSLARLVGSDVALPERVVCGQECESQIEKNSYQSLRATGFWGRLSQRTAASCFVHWFSIYSEALHWAELLFHWRIWQRARWEGHLLTQKWCKDSRGGEFLRGSRVMLGSHSLASKGMMQENLHLFSAQATSPILGI